MTQTPPSNVINHNVEHHSILPSFQHIRQQNLLTLYGHQNHNSSSDNNGNANDSNGNNTDSRRSADKSRAGHVDAPIQDLVDCINQHPSYVTLSSCSGRIVLFDPTASARCDNNRPTVLPHRSKEDGSLNTHDLERENTHAPHHDDELDVATRETTNNGTDTEMSATSRKSSVNSSSGKGGGGSWLLVSHDVIDPITDVLPFFSCSTVPEGGTIYSHDDMDDVCYFKLEPMLLHVAASNLQYGQILLQVALQTGFRESGLIVTPQRVTVAIRTNSLSLSIPLSRHSADHPLRPITEIACCCTTKTLWFDRNTGSPPPTCKARSNIHAGVSADRTILAHSFFEFVGSCYGSY
jgi:tRNA(Phe) wybutosine-synthesizing methylase Tyw3